MTSLKDLHAANIARQAEWCPDQVPDLSFRGNELGGECGEAQNVIKKLERERLGWRGSRATVDQLAEELADVVICADLCAVTAGIDLAAAVVAKFNATSDRYELTTKLVEAVRERVRHLKTGGEYDVLGEAEVQLAKPTQGVFTVAACRPVREGDRLTIYRGKDDKLWARFTDEFRDGRFETIEPADGGPA